MFDVAIIGGGICGCSLLYELSKYQVSVVLLEKENDVSIGTTKANSAIVHAGYDPAPGSRMARHNVEGNRMLHELCERLDVPFKPIGSLVLAFSEQERRTLEALLDRGVKNGVPDLRILEAAELRLMEPKVSEKAAAALYAPTAGIVSPWELAIALAETAVKNGAQVMLRSEVTAIQKESGVFFIRSEGGTVRARFVVNAAGVASGRVHDMAASPFFHIRPSKGEYYLMDKSQGGIVNHVIFQCPNEDGKGVLVTPTVHGNLLVGPNAQESESGDLANTADGLAFVKETALRSVPSINFREAIRNFAGLRAVSEMDDFLIGESDVKGFFDVAGIKSPGLTSAPSIAKDMVGMLRGAGLELKEKVEFCDTRKVVRFRDLSHEERAELIRKNPDYGQIVCRCETITEGEIVAALHRPFPPCSIDGVKRRCGSGMGRCQGGFCGPRVQEIISRELGIPMERVPQDRDGMEIVFGRTKKGERL